MRTLRSRPTLPARRIPPDLKYSGKVGSKITKLPPVAIMATAKSQPVAKPLRMRAWMENLLDNNECKGLSWVNRVDKTFEITWCHASRHDFDTKEHADVFIKYAEFTGRTSIVDDETKVYNSKLKSNFRSALHSLVDCIPVKEETSAVGTGKQKGENKVKVYQFIDPTHSEYKRKKLQKINSQRRNKKTGVSKSKNIRSLETLAADHEVHQEQQEQQEDDVTTQTPSQSPSPTILAMDLVSQDTGFLLTDEAARFIANNEENIQRRQQQQQQQHQQQHHKQQQQQQQQQQQKQIDLATTTSAVATTTTTMMMMMTSSPMSTTTTAPDSIVAIPQILTTSDPDYTLTDISHNTPAAAVIYSSSPFRRANDAESNHPAFTFTTAAAAPEENTASHHQFTKYEENQENIITCDPLEFEIVDCSALNEETDNIPPLPNFSELGVDDTFDTPIAHANKKLKSGGIMRVRKEKQSFPQPAITLLGNVELPNSMTERVESVRQPHHQEYEVLSSYFIDEEGFVSESRNSFTGPGAIGRIIGQPDAVTVVLQDEESVFQGGDYNLLNVGSMDYTP